LFRDELPKESYGRQVCEHFHEGLQNFVGSPSIASLRQILTVVRAAASRIKRKPDILSKAEQEDLNDMARNSRPPVAPTRPKLTASELKSVIERIQKRVTTIEAFDPSSITAYDPRVDALQASIDDVLTRAFGSVTVEYARYRTTLDWAAEIPSFGVARDDTQFRADVIKGKEHVLTMLRQALESLQEEMEDMNPSAATPAAGLGGPANKKVFIVHGHDDVVRETVARFLMSAGCEPIILNEQANRSRTVIEKIEANSEVRFAVVLLTPDDEGAKKGAALRPRARQNVLLELGYFLAKLGRENVCALKRDEVEIPSDFAGVIWTNYDSGGGWKRELAKELEAAGFSVDWKKAMT
jgi:predicted nucleotide-binding protein